MWVWRAGSNFRFGLVRIVRLPNSTILGKTQPALVGHSYLALGHLRYIVHRQRRHGDEWECTEACVSCKATL